MAAEQAIPLSTRKVIVVHSRTIPQGISAMLAYDPDASDNDNAIAMAEACERIATGQITFAARDSDFDGHKIKKGELLCMNNGKIAFTETNLERAVAQLAKVMIQKDSEILTVIYGADVSDTRARKIESSLNALFSDKVEITMLRGGQPIYYFFLSVE